MALIRPVRPLPSKPTKEKLVKLMQTYGLTRPTVARLMRRSVKAVDLYLLPDTSRHRRNISMACWELLLTKVQSIYHPDEEIEIAL